MQAVMRENGFQADLLVEKTVEDALAALKKQIPRYDGIISIGGDGTLNVVITAFIQLKQSIPLGIIPRGTINNFAKRWNIPNDVDEALNIIVDGQTKKVSIGSCNNEKAIVSSFTIGVLADISNDVRQKEKKKFGLIVYPLAAFRKIGRNKAHSTLSSLRPVPEKKDSKSGLHWQQRLIQSGASSTWTMTMIHFTSASCMISVSKKYFLSSVMPLQVN
ncbi:diacylglycerol/lipid kinase family protein [Vagococcus acidifermentans]|uniref:diacylglycerol/lipid kinase family protein n=1 Tax=Vagococcus acidifermentans TaxID=564710 RepID=UPI001FEA631F|nr:diacylglycerol kinase family protein [Vagococcus acidifermentans]